MYIHVCKKGGSHLQNCDPLNIKKKDRCLPFKNVLEQFYNKGDYTTQVSVIQVNKQSLIMTILANDAHL